MWAWSGEEKQDRFKAEKTKSGSNAMERRLCVLVPQGQTTLWMFAYAKAAAREAAHLRLRSFQRTCPQAVWRQWTSKTVLNNSIIPSHKPAPSTPMPGARDEDIANGF
jgi:hypothetical protein